MLNSNQFFSSSPPKIKSGLLYSRTPYAIPMLKNTEVPQSCADLLIFLGYISGVLKSPDLYFGEYGVVSQVFFMNKLNLFKP